MLTRSAFFILDELIYFVASIELIADGDYDIMDEILFEAYTLGFLTLPREPRVIPLACVSIFQLSDEDAKEKLHFSIPSSIPEYIKTDSGDVVAAIEALALVCRRMAEPCRWSTIQGEFRRSVASLSRIFICTISFLYHKHKDRLFLNMNVLRKRINEYCEATRLKGSPLRTCFGFIDGTKHVIKTTEKRRE
jgi:hypothetical protein